MTLFDEFERRPPPSLSSALRWIIPLGALLLLWIGGSVAANIYTDWLWYDNLGYLSVFTTILTTRIVLFALGAIIFLAVFSVNVYLAQRYSPHGIAPQAALNIPLEALNWARRLVVVGIVIGAILLALVFGGASSGAWETMLRFTNAASFGLVDPLFERDVSFYIFNLPLYRFIQGWALGVLVVNGLVVLGIYAINFALGGFQFTVTRTMRAHLSGLGIGVFLLLAFGYWLSVQELVYSAGGAAYGASYADVAVRLPALRLLIALSVGVALLLAANVYLKGTILPIIGAGVWFAVLILGTGALPSLVQRFQVDPNEFAREETYIARTIDMTRAGFAIADDRLDQQNYVTEVESVITQELLDANRGTIDNIRLWDHRPLRDVYNQIQFLALQYSFLDIDVDRYTIGDDYRQVMIGARELVQSQLPVTAQTWVNRKLQFTHGYGVAMSPVTEFTTKGEPILLVKNIPPESSPGAPLIERPQIYFGEATDDWVIVRSNTREFDHPTDTDPVYQSYEGPGVSINGFLRKLLFAWRFTDVNIFVTNEITSESQILYFRDIQERVGHVAPFLELDRDPYIVAADGGLYWIQDAYTVSDRFPYSEPSPAFGGVNYIRNSVKAVVNAYDGSVDFYITDPSDGIINTYAEVFPELFKPMDEMPPSLRTHIRYPEDFFVIQADKYLKFHMTQPQVFYNQEDLWEFPQELFFQESSQVMEPYYLIMQLPDEEREEFVLILPFTPADKPNLVGWLAARNDPPNYGSLIAFSFPKERQIDGTQQVEAFIDNNPIISEQFTLWSQSGSQVLRGNLLVIPVGGSILYAEPIYLQAEALDLPELKRVILVQQGQEPVMLPSLSQSLDALLLGIGGTIIEDPRTGAGFYPGASLTERLQAELNRMQGLLGDLQNQFDDVSDAFEELVTGDEPTPTPTP